MSYVTMTLWRGSRDTGLWGELGGLLGVVAVTLRGCMVGCGVGRRGLSASASECREYLLILLGGRELSEMHAG